MRAVDEALCFVAEPTEQHDLRLLRLSVGATTEITTKARSLIKVEAIGNNTKMATEINTGSAIEMRGAVVAKLIFSDDSSSTRARSTSR
jgi:hypothetical protein